MDVTRFLFLRPSAISNDVELVYVLFLVLFVVCLCECVYQQDYCKSNRPISLKLVMT